MGGGAGLVPGSSQSFVRRVPGPKSALVSARPATSCVGWGVTNSGLCVLICGMGWTIIPTRQVACALTGAEGVCVCGCVCERKH